MEARPNALGHQTGAVPSTHTGSTKMQYSSDTLGRLSYKRAANQSVTVTSIDIERPSGRLAEH